MADLHTHVIPGVDDGAPDMEAALATLERLSGDGVTAVAATPHLNASSPNGRRRQQADERWPSLVERARERVPDLELHRGFELQLDRPEVDLSDEGLRLAGGRFVLVEFRAFTIPQRSAEALARIHDGGYVPLIAHPERYWGYDGDYSLVPEWRRAGALLQLNGGSLLGENGAHVRAVAQRFLGEGWVDVIASDNHARPGRDLSLREIREFLEDRGLKEPARLLLCENPHRLLRDEAPLPVGQVPLGRGLFSKLKRAFMGDG